MILERPRTTAFALGVDAALAAAVLSYLWGLRITGPGGDRRCRPQLRAASFLFGALLVYVAIGSGLAAYQGRPSIVVVQHVLLMMAAPPFLVLGRPRDAWAALGRTSPRGTLPSGRTGGGPSMWTGLVVWVLYYGSMAAYFLTALMPDSVRHPDLLAATQLWFVAVGVLFFSVVLGGGRAGRPAGYGTRIVSLLAGTPVESAVGIALVLWRHPILAGVSLSATHTSGLVLWISSMLTSGLALAIVVAQWCIDDSRRGEQNDPLVDLAMAAVIPGDGRGSVLP
jgi:cytochrome c oxidase assembly factor CtaG